MDCCIWRSAACCWGGARGFGAAAGTGDAGDHPGFSSTVLAAKSLEEKAELRAFHGRVAIGILIIQTAALVLMTVAGVGAPSL